MTSPVSPSETIAKAMEGADLAQRECIFAAQEARKANGADTYPARVLDKAAGVIAALALKLEAMQQREELLVGGLCGSTAMRFAVGAGEHSLALHFVNSETLDMFQDGLRAYIDIARARTLIQGEKK